MLKDTSPIVFIHPRKALIDAHSSSKIGSEATASVETANVEKVESCKEDLGGYWGDRSMAPYLYSSLPSLGPAG